MSYKIPIYRPWVTDQDKKFVKDAIESGWISSIGKYIDLFEDEFCKFIGSKYSVSTNNGTSACHLALLSNGIGYGDEVIVPSSTFIACPNSVRYCGAEVVLADVDLLTWNISLESIKEKTTNRTKAVFLVHMLGNPCCEEIYDWCDDKGIICIEDACESIGASLNNKKTGSLGKCAAFSFFGNKNLTTGEGGMITTNDVNVFERAKYLRGQAQDSTYIHGDIGFNYRMTNIQAAIGYSQMLRIEEIICEKSRVFETYRKNLKSIVGQNNFKFQKTTKNSQHANWMFAVYSETTSNIKQDLHNEGIDTRPMFYPVNSMKPYKSNEIFKNAEDLSKNVFMLPSYPELQDKDIVKICNIVKKSNAKNV
jgi:perosamine synthetase